MVSFSTTVEEMSEPLKREAMFDSSIYQLAVRITGEKSPFMTLNGDEFELSDKLSIVSAEPRKKVEVLSAANNACVCVQRLVRSVVGHSVVALDAVGSQVRSQVCKPISCLLTVAINYCI